MATWQMPAMLGAKPLYSPCSPSSRVMRRSASNVLLYATCGGGGRGGVSKQPLARSPQRRPHVLPTAHGAADRRGKPRMQAPCVRLLCVRASCAEKVARRTCRARP